MSFVVVTNPNFLFYIIYYDIFVVN